tara:strand:- start:614 stop:955 length:342 start_codon:yes stop_codon:yes gene_type:complete
VVKNIAYILAMLLFVSSYFICDLFYYNEYVKNLEKWWDLKVDLYAIILVLICYGSSIGSKKYTRLILDIFLGVCIANLIDKVFFNVLEFNKNDIIMIIITVCLSVLDCLNNKK